MRFHGWISRKGDLRPYRTGKNAIPLSHPGVVRGRCIPQRGRWKPSVLNGARDPPHVAAALMFRKSRNYTAHAVHEGTHDVVIFSLYNASTRHTHSSPALNSSLRNPNLVVH